MKYIFVVLGVSMGIAFALVLSSSGPSGPCIDFSDETSYCGDKARAYCRDRTTEGCVHLKVDDLIQGH